MTETLKDVQNKVYEIGYILISSIPVEKVAEVVASLKEVLSKKGAEIIAFEDPELRPLAFIMTKKIGTQNHRFDQGYFGWVKFMLGTSEIESVKKALELYPDMLRMLVMTTVKENTYLGKKAPIANLPKIEDVAGEITGAVAEPAVVATVDEMDKSIDEMVKGA